MGRYKEDAVGSDLVIHSCDWLQNRLQTWKRKFPHQFVGQVSLILLCLDLLLKNLLKKFFITF